MSVVEQVSEGGSFRLNVSRHAQRMIIEVRGDLGMATAPILEGELLAAEASDAVRIVLDLSELSFIDSSGLAAVLRAARRSDEDANRLRVVAGDGHVAEWLKLTAIDQVVPLLD
jgi:anti-sigma B factor antagonist